MRRFAVVFALLAATTLAQQPFELKTDGDQLTLSIADEGVPLTDFVKLAQKVTGEAFSFSATEIAAADPVTLTGKMRIQKADFLGFFETVLSTKGFAAVTHGEGEARVIEIVPAKDADDGTKARYVSSTELEAHKAGTQPIITAFEPVHVSAAGAMKRLTSALAAAGVEARLSRAGKTILAQGAGSEVYRVSQMLRLMDVPSNLVFRVVALKHATGVDLASGLRLLVAERESRVVIVADAESGSIMVSGPEGVVDQVVELAFLLDRPKQK